MKSGLYRLGVGIMLLNTKNKVDQFSQTKNKTISLLKKINKKNQLSLNF